MGGGGRAGERWEGSWSATARRQGWEASERNTACWLDATRGASAPCHAPAPAPSLTWNSTSSSLTRSCCLQGAKERHRAQRRRSAPTRCAHVSRRRCSRLSRARSLPRQHRAPAPRPHLHHICTPPTNPPFAHRSAWMEPTRSCTRTLVRSPRRPRPCTGSKSGSSPTAAAAAAPPPATASCAGGRVQRGRGQVSAPTPAPFAPTGRQLRGPAGIRSRLPLPSPMDEPHTPPTWRVFTTSMMRSSTLPLT